MDSVPSNMKSNTWSLAKLLTSVAAAAALLYCITGFEHQLNIASNQWNKTVPLKRPVVKIPTVLLRQPPQEWLFDLKPFNYTLNSKGCSVLTTKNRINRLRFAVIVHSKPEHFRQRQIIRSTWASLTRHVRAIFLLGETRDTKTRAHWQLDTAALVQAEHNKYGDIVQGNFRDTYKNLTYKHVMGLKWISEYCTDVDYVIKTDDDAFVNIIGLEEFLKRTFSKPPEDNLLCNVVPEGSTVLRTGKYSLSDKEFPWKTYPRFCSGLAYITTPVFARKLYQASQYISPVRIDDVYVTGLLAESVSAKYFYLNLRYSYNTNASENDWNRFLFGELNTASSDWREVSTALWHNVSKSKTAV